MGGQTLEARLRQGGLDEILRKLYGAPHLERARTRCAGVLEGFAGAFGGEAQALFSAPGRSWGETIRTTNTARSWRLEWTWIFWPPWLPTRAA